MAILVYLHHSDDKPATLEGGRGLVFPLPFVGEESRGPEHVGGQLKSKNSLSVGSGCIGKGPLALLLPSSFFDLLLKGLVVERSVSSTRCC